MDSFIGILFIVGVFYFIAKANQAKNNQKKPGNSANNAINKIFGQDGTNKTNKFDIDNDSFKYNKNDYSVPDFKSEKRRSTAKNKTVNDAYSTVSAKDDIAMATYNTGSDDYDGNPLTNVNPVTVLKERKKLPIPNTYKKVSSKIDLSMSSFERSIKSQYFGNSNAKYDAFTKSDIYLRIFKTKDYKLNIRVSKDYNLIELKLKILQPDAPIFERLYLASKNFLTVSLIIDLDLFIVDTFVRSTSGEYEVGNYLFEYPKINLKMINEGSYSYTDSKAITYLTISLAKKLEPNFESFI